jgi:multiple sugar transport system permease protein
MKQLNLREYSDALLFLLPLVLFILIFIFWPTVGTIVTSFYRDISFLGREFVLYENYVQLFVDAEFIQSFRFTLLFVLVSVPLELLVGMIFALLLNEKIPGRGFLRATVLIPWAIPAAISARTWELIYNYNFGLANFMCLKLGLSTEPINWLGSSLGAFISLVVADTWKTTPFVAIILLAGLQAIPEELYRQARVDRANFVQRFFRVTLPLLKPVIVVALLFRTIDALRVFDIIYVLTGGGPGGATTSLSLYGYRQFLSGDYGYGSAVSIVLFVVALTLSLLYVRATRFEEVIK